MKRSFSRLSYALLNLGILLNLSSLGSPMTAIAGAGHSHGNEFKDSGAAVESTNVTIDRDIATKLQIKTQTVQRRQLSAGLKTTGQIEIAPNQKAEVTNPVTGKITGLLVKPGDTVKAGQTVALMSSPELIELRVKASEQKAIAQSELKQAIADLKLAQENYTRTQNIFQAASVGDNLKLAAKDPSLFGSNSVLAVAKDNYDRQRQIAQSEIESANIELSVAREQYERDRELADNGAITRRQMRESEAKYASAQAKLVQAQSRPNVLEAQSKLKQAELDFRKELASVRTDVNQAQSAVEAAQEKLRLSDLTYKSRLAQLQTTANSDGSVTIRAPISGRVATREVTVGQSFQDAGGKLMTIIDDGRVLVSANIYEKDLSRVKVGQVVRVKVNGITGSLQGFISTIGSTVETENRVIPVKALLNNPSGQIKPGMFANLEILTDDNEVEIIAIPQTAIVEANNKNLVYVENGNGYQAVEVTLGETYGDLVEIKTGLFTGDIVVTQRAPQLYAQALKGGGSDSHDDEAQEPQAKGKNPQVSSFEQLWWLIPVGGLLGGGMFWLGLKSGKRRQSLDLADIKDTIEHLSSESLEKTEKIP
ncbi:MAG: hypothetical protein N5P05_003952 [Chroococcopsis gigantea SAG 12.99]|jgi:cobalt-zinc-cadmium efflux system membrane fusion protein|nr:efflux RND transporter periplasmic adaptor subunit [Chlorogloea purpurea SAG 13.99]MDV3002346.1 hypothetical protein [Chroococcopsis gigantea SAG 12.99]